MRDDCRPYDVVCRIGGDEFGIIFPETDSVNAYRICQRIRDDLNEFDLFPYQKISISVGIAEYPSHGGNKAELVKKADNALYWAKYQGKSEVVIYDEGTVKLFEMKERLQLLEKRSYLSTVRALAAAVDARDPCTRFHSRNVAALASALAKKINLEEERVRKIEIAGLLHDVGKIGIPDSILKKSEKLSPAEKKIIEEHPVLGERILKNTDLIDILPWIRAHHERWDGKGYPDRLKGEEIPIEARILALADAFDAMTSERPYQDALTLEEAVKEIETHKGTQFDPLLADTFIKLIKEGKIKLKGADRIKKEVIVEA